MQQIAPPQEVYAQPANLHVARFMGYRNVLELDVAQRGAATASRSPARASRSPARASSRSPAAARCGRDPARGGRSSADAGATNAIAGQVDNVEYCGRDSLRRRRDRRRNACCTCARRAQPRVGDAGRACRCRSSACSSIRANEPWRMAAAEPLAREPVRPHAAAGRAGGAVHAAAVHLSVPLRACGCRSRRRRAARSPTTRTSSPPTICGRRSGPRCKLALPATLINVGLALPIAFKMRVKTRYQRWVTTILVVPITLGTVLIAEGMLTYFGPQGLARRSSCSSSTSTTGRSGSRTTTGAC